MRDFEHSLPMELLKARESAMAKFRPMLRKHGLTEQQWRVIRTLAAFEKLDAGEIARYSFLLAPSLTRILQYLHGKNLVSRAADANDQRRAVFTLTADGRKTFSLVAPDSEALYAKIENAFGKEKLNLLYELLSDFYTTLAAEKVSQDSAR